MPDNVQDYITFTSPEGNQFSARWIGNTRSKSKAIGRFHSPGAIGDRTQDQGIKSPDYPLTFFFDGDDYIANALSFWNACDETGIWEVNHPESGLLNLQLVTVQEDQQPITSGNVRQFTSSWFAPNLEDDTASTAELKSAITADVNNLNASAAEELANNIDQSQQVNIEAFIDSIENVAADASTAVQDIWNSSSLSGVADTAIGVFETVAAATSAAKEALEEAQDEFDTIEASITSAIDAAADVALSPLVIGSQIQTLIQSPANAIDSISGRVSAYEDLGALYADRLGFSATTAGKNGAQTIQTGILGTLSGLALATTTGELETREQALEAAEDIKALFDTMTTALDTQAAVFSDSDIENQFFSQTESYNRISQIIANAVDLLLNEAFSLKVEKTLVLTQDKSPVQVCVEEYGSLGDNDSILNYFYTTNNLYGNDNLLLYAGTEVKIYK